MQHLACVMFVLEAHLDARAVVHFPSFNRISPFTDAIAMLQMMITALHSSSNEMVSMQVLGGQKGQATASMEAATGLGEAEAAEQPLPELHNGVNGTATDGNSELHDSIMAGTEEAAKSL